MAISSISAGKTLCELSGWSVSNLRLQKILYFAHMFHLGIEGEPLINEAFEAWDYGPVVPSLYHRVKMFGSRPIAKGAFFWDVGADVGSSEYRLLKQTYEATKERTAGEMVSITHWEKGAWYEAYKPGVPHISISDELILKEHRARSRTFEGLEQLK